ncbi:MAG: FtsX-like permease family protein, partial [Flavitalea sp.]
VPEDSHIKFDMLISFETIGTQWGYTEWTYPEFYNYVVLAPGTDPKRVEAKFPAFVEKHLGAKMRELNFKSNFHLQPVTDIHLNSNYRMEAEANGSQKEVYFLSIIGLFILVIAWINYINLSTAKSMERAKEVGLRKVVGARKGQLIVQFLFESLIINLMALLVAAIIVLVCMPLFGHFIGKDIGKGFFSVGLGADPGFWMMVFFIFIAGALLVGAYPALILSSFKPVSVLKGIAVKSNSGVSLRRALVSFQFILSIILIAATIIIFRQLSFMRNQDLGYSKDQLLVVKAPAVIDTTVFAKYEYFKTELSKNPAVISSSFSSDIPGMLIRYRNGVYRANQDKSQSYTVNLMEVNENFITTFKIPMVAGRNFGSQESDRMGSDTTNTQILVNEEVVSGLGYKSPGEAVNQKVIFSLGQFEVKCTIKGVVKNYHQKSLKEKYEPILYYYPNRTDWKYMAINMNVAGLDKQLPGIDKLYRSIFPGNPFEYFFLDEFFNKQYQSDQRLGNVFGLFTILAIIVSCLGLLGLSSFVIKLRTKEIGIRKALGANLASILVLFSKDFVRMVIIASVIAIPITYFAAGKWLQNYAFHIGLNWFIFVAPPVALLMIVLLTISLQSLRAVLTNPIKSLRSE